MSARIYDRPDLDQLAGRRPLLLEGTLPEYVARVAYEGRLQISNAVGACWADLYAGELPPGYSIWVDAASQEVVIAWPDYVSAAAPISNPGFELGESGWNRGAGWEIATDNVPVGERCAAFQNAKGESLISNQVRYDVTPGEVISASCLVRQGASSAGNAGACVVLEYRDDDGKVIVYHEGNRVMSASHNAVKTSSVTSTAPAGAATVNIAGKGIRKRQNKRLWIDAFQWNKKIAAVGVADDDYEATITIRVRDSAGRVAYWTGDIVAYAVYLTSNIYPVYTNDGFGVIPYFISASTEVIYKSIEQPAEDFISVSPYFVSAGTKSIYNEYMQPAEDFLSVTPYFVSASTKVVYNSHMQPAEDFISVAPYFVSASTNKVLVTNKIPAESISLAPYFVSASTTTA